MNILQSPNDALFAELIGICRIGDCRLYRPASVRTIDRVRMGSAIHPFGRVCWHQYTAARNCLLIDAKKEMNAGVIDADSSTRSLIVRLTASKVTEFRGTDHTPSRRRKIQVAGKLQLIQLQQKWKATKKKAITGKSK